MTQPIRIRRLNLFTLLTLALPISASANPGTLRPFCKPQMVTDSLVQGRAPKFLFPDGRELTVIGHESADAKILELSELVLSQKLGKLNDVDFAKLIKSTQEELAAPSKSMALNSNRKAVAEAIRKQTGISAGGSIDKAGGLEINGANATNHAVQDYTYLREVFSKPSTYGRIEFVGLEEGSKIWPVQKTSILITQQNLIREISQRRSKDKLVITDKEVGDLLAAATGGNLYAYIREPRLESIAPLVSIDSTLDIDEIRMQKEKLALLWEQISSPEATTAHQNGTLALVKQLEQDVLGGEISSVAELEKRVSIIDGIKSEAPPLVSEAFGRLAMIYRQVVRMQVAAEYETARKLVERYQSGIHFVELGHYGLMTKSVQQLCDAEMSIGQATLPVYSAKTNAVSQ